MSIHTRRALAASAAIPALIGIVACGATAGGHSSATTTPGVPAGVAIPPGAVPWAAVPFQPYLPTPLPIPTAIAAPRCSLADLTAQPPSTGGVTGNEAVFFSFTNRTSHLCLTGGYPRVVLSQPGQQSLVASPGSFWDEHTPAADLAPGATARFAVGFSNSCAAQLAPQPYAHIAVTLPGGGSFVTVLSGAQPSDSQIPLGVFAQCGVTVSEFSAPSPERVYPLDPLLELTATMTAPTSVRAGAVFKYVITLVNPTSKAIALDPCRGYYQQVDSMKSGYFSYQLNCAAAQPVVAHGSESFVIEMTAAGISSGLQTLQWHLDAGGALGGAGASATINIMS